MKPTKEQEKQFWKRCGFKHFGGHSIEWLAPDDLTAMDKLPPVDLNNLFKYAAPKLFERGCWIKTNHHHSMYEQDESHSISIGQHKFTGEGEFTSGQNFALALFWAIYKTLCFPDSLWICDICGKCQPIESTTDKYTVRCIRCGRLHAITGHHIDGSPITHAVAVA